MELDSVWPKNACSTKWSKMTIENTLITFLATILKPDTKNTPTRTVHSHCYLNHGWIKVRSVNKNSWHIFGRIIMLVADKWQEILLHRKSKMLACTNILIERIDLANKGCPRPISDLLWRFLAVLPYQVRASESLTIVIRRPSLTWLRNLQSGPHPSFRFQTRRFSDGIVIWTFSLCSSYFRFISLSESFD